MTLNIEELNRTHVVGGGTLCLGCDEPYPCPTRQLLDLRAAYRACYEEQTKPIIEKLEAQLAQATAALERAGEIEQAFAERVHRLDVATAGFMAWLETDPDAAYLGCADTPFCQKGDDHSPGCVVYEARRWFGTKWKDIARAAIEATA